MGLGFLHINNLKLKNLSLPLKVETDEFVICLVLPECLSVKIFRISPSNSEANHDGADTEFSVVFLFSASFKNSSPREKVRNCLHFGTGGWSLCFYPLLSRKILPHTNNGRSCPKKIFWQSDLLAQ